MIKFTAPQAVTLTRHAAFWDGTGTIAAQLQKSLDLLNHWHALRRAGADKEQPPSFAAFLPAEIPKILPHIFLLERLACGGDWRVRLAGTYITTILDKDITALRLQEIDILGGYHASYRQFCEQVAAGRSAVIASGCKAGWSQSFQHFEIVHAPVLSRDESDVWILGGVFPISRS